MQQVVAHGVHHSLFRFALAAQVGIVARIENVEAPLAFDHRAGENVEVLLLRRAARQHLAVLAEVNKILGAHLVPGSSLAVLVPVPPVVQIEEMVSPVLVKGDEIRSPRSHRPVEKLAAAVVAGRRRGRNSLRRPPCQAQLPTRQQGPRSQTFYELPSLHVRFLSPLRGCKHSNVTLTHGSRAGRVAQRSKPDRALAFRGAQAYAMNCPKIENGNSGGNGALDGLGRLFPMARRFRPEAGLRKCDDPV